MTTLDEDFGEAQLAGGDGVRVGEDMYRPASLAVLRGTGEQNLALLGHLLSTASGCRATRYLCESATILWLIDDEGAFRIAIEEAQHPQDPDITIPILRHNKMGSQGWHKLGHPALLDRAEKLARIGGELRFRTAGYWEINNSSGRYGIRCGRTERQLENVADYLRSFGLKIDTDFI